MASLFKASQLRSAWSPEECGVFAAHKEFELLKLLSTADKKVISMARKMGHAAVNAQVNKQGMQEHPGSLLTPATRTRESPKVGGQRLSVRQSAASKSGGSGRKQQASSKQWHAHS